MKYHSTMHKTHLLLTIITGGAWFIIWVLMTLINNQKNDKMRFHNQLNK